MPLIDKRSEKQKLMDKAYNKIWIIIFIAWVISFFIFRVLFSWVLPLHFYLFLVIYGVVIAPMITALIWVFFKKRFERKIDEINRSFKDVPGPKPENGHG
ncbi:MAG: hypothetical protein MUO91_00055 [candidate division Zixibacteria bacterium]|nr:hypothetical protein [candidate division Zixibacteria bacterium]